MRQNGVLRLFLCWAWSGRRILPPAHNYEGQGFGRICSGRYRSLALVRLV